MQYCKSRWGSFSHSLDFLGLYMKLDLFTKWCVTSQVLTDHRSLASWVCSPCLGHGISATASFCFPRCLKVLNPIKVVL